MTVDQDRLMSTDCADVWAEEFAKIRPEIDRGLMIAWFANCAETAKDLLHRRGQPESTPAQPEPKDGPAAICGEAPVPIDPDLIGCGKPIMTAAEIYRCTDCDVPFHKACAIKHFATDTPENAQAVFREQLKRNGEVDAEEALFPEVVSPPSPEPQPKTEKAAVRDIVQQVEAQPEPKDGMPVALHLLTPQQLLPIWQERNGPGIPMGWANIYEFFVECVKRFALPSSRATLTSQPSLPPTGD